MAIDEIVSDEQLERFREYLRLLAQVQVNPSLRDRVDLSGVVQQTLLEAHSARRLSVDLPPAQVLAWLRQALANNLRDEFRKLNAGARDVQRERSLEVALDQSALQLEQWLAATGPSPSEFLRREEQSLTLACALAKLPTAQRDALVLQHWHGMTLANIAEQLGKTPAAVAGLLKRGLRQLREDLHVE